MSDLVWTPVKIRLGQIIPWTENPRMSTKAQAQRLIKSERELGTPQTLAVSPFTEDNRVDLYDGHQRTAAWLTVKDPSYEVWALQSNRPLSEDERRKISVLLHTATGSWDWNALSGWSAADLREWGMDGETLKGWNNDANNLKEMLKADEAETVDAEPQIDRAEELREKWGVKLGDLWQVGEHRIICGDSTSKEDVKKVMNGDCFRLCFTSPPYADQRTYEIGEFDWLVLMNGVSDCLFDVIGSPADVVINLGMSYKDGKVNFYWNDWLEYCENLGQCLYGMYVWDKGYGFPGEWNGRLAPAHEFLFHFSVGRVSANKWIETITEKKPASGKRFRQRDGSKKEAYSDDKIGQPFKVPDSVVRVSPQRGAIPVGDHPAPFSVDFAEFGIKTWSVKEDIIYEPFSGSGTTMVACQNLNRRCRAVEISPAYVAVALERMATAFPGIEIKRINGTSD